MAESEVPEMPERKLLEVAERPKVKEGDTVLTKKVVA